MTKRRGDDLRPEYDPPPSKAGYGASTTSRPSRGPNLVLLEPDVARAFPCSRSVNRALTHSGIM